MQTLLDPCDLPEELESICTVKVDRVLPPLFATKAPQRSDFWNFSSDGEELSTLGCFPITRGVSQSQYCAILESQQHLGALNILRPLEDVEILKLTDQLQTIQESSKYQSILSSLILGLASNEIHVFKGLDTGFRLPETNVQLWGLSAPSSTSSCDVDIFISQKAPSIVSTVLHAYFAHHGVPHEQIYEEELLLNQANNTTGELKLPLSIQRELAEATNSELLFLLEQIKVTSPDHSFMDEIKRTCISFLIDESARVGWTEAQTKGFLEGSVSMQDLLQQRLEHFARNGVRSLPRMESLLKLSQEVDETIADALFRADRDVLDSMTNALLKAYDPWRSWSQCEYVDINADLFALMYFCALRRAAFEDVYLETTDRCPYFLAQPDQAAVFSEMWVLGSQCEIYFGILPRALGKLIYDLYRAHLKDNPPPPNSWNRAEVFTAYSFTTPATPSIQGTSESNFRRKFITFRDIVLELGALSIFCMPAVIDVCLLTFVGRGLFLTAFMADKERLMATYALLTALLISAGVTGWVGGVGGHYLYNVSSFFAFI
jgi:hypothetical protein